MVKIWVKYEITLDLDDEGLEHLKPEWFDEDSGELIANDAEILKWIKYEGGEQIIQQYFVSDIISITDEINYEYIEVMVE